MTEPEALRSLVDALYERIEEEMLLNEELRQQNAMLDKKLAQLEGRTRKATRDEKIVRPGVYEVPVVCPACGKTTDGIHTCSPQIRE